MLIDPFVTLYIHLYSEDMFASPITRGEWVDNVIYIVRMASQKDMIEI